MSFALRDSIKKGAVANPTQICDGTTSHHGSDGPLSRQGDSSHQEVCHFFSFGDSGKKGTGSRDRRLKKIKPGDVVLLEFAGNCCSYDWKAVSEAPEATHAPQMTLSDFRSLYEEVISRFRTLGAKPVLLSLPALLPQRYFDFVSEGLNKGNILQWLGGDVNRLSEWYEQYSQEVYKLGNEFKVQVEDISTVLLDRRSLGDCYSPDGMHPNKRGYAMIVESITASRLSV